MFRIDLHTHSIASPDGGLTEKQYESALNKKLLDTIAITDHNTIEFAVEMNKKLGGRIIVGEEIMTESGEIIGLYLKRHVPAGLPLSEAVDQIKSQGGLVYIPHPFEKVRSGIAKTELEKIRDQIDIIEVINGRAFVGSKTAEAGIFAEKNGLPGAAGSDAHGSSGWGRTYTAVSDLPTKNSLAPLVAAGKRVYKKPNLQAVLYPKYYRLKRRLTL